MGRWKMLAILIAAYGSVWLAAGYGMQFLFGTAVAVKVGGWLTVAMFIALLVHVSYYERKSK
jgi:hypothetical protein